MARWEKASIRTVNRAMLASAMPPVSQNRERMFPISRSAFKKTTQYPFSFCAILYRYYETKP